MTVETPKKGTPIEFHIPEGQVTLFATNIVVQAMMSEFKILFFEAKPPLRLDDSEPFPDKVRADCVASVIVTADRLPSFIEILREQLDKF